MTLGVLNCEFATPVAVNVKLPLVVAGLIVSARDTLNVAPMPIEAPSVRILSPDFTMNPVGIDTVISDRFQTKYPWT